MGLKSKHEIRSSLTAKSKVVNVINHQCIAFSHIIKIRFCLFYDWFSNVSCVSTIAENHTIIVQFFPKDSLLDSHFGKNKLALEWFPLTFTSPYPQDEWNLQGIGQCHQFWFYFPIAQESWVSLKTKNLENLDVWQVHEVLGYVNKELIHESRGNVVAIHIIIELVPAQTIQW